jgi:uncharacterized sulfatase
MTDPSHLVWRSVAPFAIACLASLAMGMAAPLAVAAERPNILWITCEDMSPTLGCYGDDFAKTPAIDRLAQQGVRFTRAFANASVCTPARSCLITGVHPTALGSQHLRGPVRLPERVTCFTEHLRAAGYYCSNNVKQDYNFTAPAGSWDESSAQAHWRKRAGNQPFFSVFNSMLTHQSRLRFSPAELAEITREFAPDEFHDPAKAPLPPYYPDTPGIRRELARNYDLITAMDKWVGQILAELDADGLAEDTIVFFYSDHGTGMPRHKRALYDSGLRVPLVVRIPPKYRHLCPNAPGAVSGQLVSFVDFAPTVLSLAGIEPPKYMQGRAFLGKPPANERTYVFAVRDRVDELFEMSRAVCDHRHKYIRHFMPHRPFMGLSAYSEPAESVRAWRQLAAAGTLKGPASLYMANTKPIEELFDIQADPHEINNLAADPAQRETLERMRGALHAWMLETRDMGLLGEAEMFRRAGDGTIYDLARSQHASGEPQVPLARILEAADLVGRPETTTQRLAELLGDDEPAVRYWGAVGLMAPGVDARPAADALERTLADESPDVRLASAEALCRIGRAERALPIIAAALADADVRVRLHAAAVAVAIGAQACPLRDAVHRLRQDQTPGDYADFARWAAGHVLRRCGEAVPADFE